MLGDALEVGVDLGARVRRAGRVVRDADVDELRPGADRTQERVEVVAPVPERHGPGDRAELPGVDRVARERGPAADDLVARLEHRLAEAVDDPVRSGSGRDLLEAQVEPLRERGAEPVRAAVGVAVELSGAALDRLARLRERAERPLVGGELDHALEPELALNLLDGLARLVGNEVLYGRREEAVRDLRKRAGHGSDSSAGLRSRAASRSRTGSD